MPLKYQWGSSAKKYLKFITTIIATIEEAALRFSKTQTDNLRCKVRQVLEKNSQTSQERKRIAIKTLQSDTQIIILPAENGNAIVVIKKL